MITLHACIFYITLLFCISTRAIPVDGYSASNRQTGIPTSDNEKELEPVKNSGRRSRKRTINAVEENADLLLQEGIF